MSNPVHEFTLRASAPSTEYSKQFLQGMVDRMSVSYYKYGKVADAVPFQVDALRSLKIRIDKYLETGNTEFLMDAANFAMMEFMHPHLPEAHFTPTDADGSPGRRAVSGRRITDESNAELAEQADW